MYICIYLCVYIYIYIYVYAHTYINMYKHIYVYTHKMSLVPKAPPMPCILKSAWLLQPRTR